MRVPCFLGEVTFLCDALQVVLTHAGDGVGPVEEPGQHVGDGQAEDEEHQQPRPGNLVSEHAVLQIKIKEHSSDHDNIEEKTADAGQSYLASVHHCLATAAWHT